MRAAHFQRVQDGRQTHGLVDGQRGGGTASAARRTVLDGFVASALAAVGRPPFYAPPLPLVLEIGFAWVVLELKPHNLGYEQRRRVTSSYGFVGLRVVLPDCVVVVAFLVQEDVVAAQEMWVALVVPHAHDLAPVHGLFLVGA